MQIFISFPIFFKLYKCVSSGTFVKTTYILWGEWHASAKGELVNSKIFQTNRWVLLKNNIAFIPAYFNNVIYRTIIMYHKIPTNLNSSWDGWLICIKHTCIIYHYCVKCITNLHLCNPSYHRKINFYYAFYFLPSVVWFPRKDAKRQNNFYILRNYS